MPTACITGASSGIGKEFALQLGKQGYNLILIARNYEALRKIAAEIDTKCKIITCDLASERACINLAGQLKKYNISILINNAGFGDIGAFYKTSLSKDLDMIDVNVRAAHILTKELLPDFIRRDKGYILNVASSAGLLPGGPYMATYYATKAYVTSFTSAISEELKALHSHVSVSVLCPGPVDTNFNNVANVQFALKGISASYCARYALKKMYQKKLIIVPTFTMKAAVFSARLLPRSTMLKITSKQQTKKFHRSSPSARQLFR